MLAFSSVFIDQYDDTCQTKCSVTIQNLHNNGWYYLKNIHLKDIDKSFSTICSSRQEDNRSKDLVIDCSPRTFGNVTNMYILGSIFFVRVKIG